MVCRIGILLGLVSILFGCSSGYESPYYVKLADRITNRTAKKLRAEKNLYLVGTGGRMMDDIQMMAMTFYCYHEVDFEEGRDLLVYAVSEYLAAINGSEEIKPYLHDCPFTAKNIKIYIFFFGPDRLALPSGKINCIDCLNGKLGYYVRSDYFNPIHEETYEEGLRIVRGENGV